MEAIEGPDPIRESQRWLDHSRTLLAVSRFLFHHPGPSTGLRSGEDLTLALGKLYGAQNLLGSAVECTLKAMAIARGLMVTSPISDETLLPAPWGSHNHSRMAATLDLALSDEQSALLARTSHYVRWVGRYPDARTRDDLKAAIKVNASVTSPRDFDVAEHLFRAAEEEVATRRITTLAADEGS
jgi:hypothetical protein